MSLSHRISAFILPLFIISFLSAQVSVSGVVTNDKGDALSGANVYLAGTSLGAAAKSDGKYQINNVPAGNYTLVFSYLGYSTMETSVQVGNSNATQNAQLSRAALEIEALQVTGTIIKDRVTPFPHSSLTSEDLELLLDESISCSKSGDDNALDFVLNWSTKPVKNLMNESYVNLIPTAQGGSHLNGFKTGLLEAVKEFCEFNFNITFPITEISEVKGSSAHPIYKWALQNYGSSAKPKWNFHKYLIIWPGSAKLESINALYIPSLAC